MAFEQPGFSIGFTKAAADLRTKQYYAVKITDVDTVNLTAAAGEKAIGILQNKPNTGETAQIMCMGVTKVIAGAAISVGAIVEADNGGKIIAATAAKVGIGTALQAASNDGDLITIFLNAGTGNALAA